MSRKQEKGLRNSKLYYSFIVLASVITGCISVSAIAYLLGIPIGVTSSPIGLKIWAIAAGIKYKSKRYKSIIKKKKKNHDKIVLLAKTKLNTIEFLISKSLML